MCLGYLVAATELFSLATLHTLLLSGLYKRSVKFTFPENGKYHIGNIISKLGYNLAKRNLN